MTDELKKFEFLGAVGVVAEKHYHASTVCDTDMRFANKLYADYAREMATAKPKAWLRKELAKYFLWIDQPPRWIETTSSPPWPFADGLPMVFIRQFTVAAENEAGERLASGNELYIFGLRVDGDEGWSMRYEVVEQLPDL